MQTCSVCNAPNPLQHNFCDQCGAPVSAAVADSASGVAAGGIHSDLKALSRIIRIGREFDMDVIIDPETQQVSRHHADIVEFPHGRLEIIDRSSGNGTLVNGVRLIPGEPYPLELTDRVELGSYRLNLAQIREKLHYAHSLRPDGTPGVPMWPAPGDAALAPLAPRSPARLESIEPPRPARLEGHQIALLIAAVVLVLLAVASALK